MALLSSRGLPLEFQIRRVYCVGRNYAEHRKEMGGSDRDPPFFFMKPFDAVHQARRIPFPSNTRDLNYEGELVLFMGEGDKVYGLSLGVDLTKRDLQATAKKGGRPWESSKSFDGSGILGPITPLSEIDGGMLSVEKAQLQLVLNGELKQSATIDSMIWSTQELIQQLKNQDFSVKKGDIIFTGTPAGVGQLNVGDECSVRLLSDNHDILSPLVFNVV
jgi:fumarylpyruvate hydrolase